jgi:4a-hydroxytetrahydrobiopterin dehydratase
VSLQRLSATSASATLEATAWRFVLGSLVARVDVPDSARGLRVAEAAVQACGADADGHLRVDLRPTYVELVVQTAEVTSVTSADVELTHRIGAAVEALGHRLSGAVSDDRRSSQLMEIAVDALDIDAVRPFWRAVLGYVDGPVGDLVDPARQGPAVWFQQMDAPRPQRNRIHLDVAVPHDEAPARVQAALDAGGVLVSDAHARAFWVLADVEGNEVCVCTWQDREPAGDTA